MLRIHYCFYCGAEQSSFDNECFECGACGIPYDAAAKLVSPLVVAENKILKETLKRISDSEHHRQIICNEKDVRLYTHRIGCMESEYKDRMEDTKNNEDDV